MIPKSNVNLSGLTATKQTSKTYRLDLEKGIIVDYTDHKEAMEQAIYKILNSERFRHEIYSWNYGAELDGIMGRSKDYVYSEIKSRVEEALLQDDRIMSVGDFQFQSKKGTVSVVFKVKTTEGELEIQKDVRASV